MNKENKEIVKEIWKNYWKRIEPENIIFDSMSKKIFEEILKIVGNVRDKKILEAGSGTGVISAELALRGAKVFLLDISERSLLLSQSYFKKKKIEASFILDDLLNLNINDQKFDIIWNAGVMEHFTPDEQSKALCNISKILKDGGLFISFNPSSHAIFYRIGKWVAEKRQKWPYGPEYPVESLKRSCEKAGFTRVSEWEICFFEQLNFLLYINKYLKNTISKLLTHFHEEFLIKIFGGYLLVTIAKK